MTLKKIFFMFLFINLICIVFYFVIVVYPTLIMWMFILCNIDIDNKLIILNMI